MNSSIPTKQLLLEFDAMWNEADDIWTNQMDDPAFRGYVSADFLAVFESLLKLQDSVQTVLEWGSGLGIVTIMASRLGFDAYGIEAEQDLVDHSERLAETYGPNARFATGSFIPDQFEWNPSEGDNVHGTIIDDAAAYDELDMELRDFDLVYAYPWPDEHILYQNIMRQFGRKNAILMSYDAREGVELLRF